MMIKRLASCAAIALLFAGAASPASAQITGVSPSGTTNVKAADDWATVSFQDPMDMKQNTDLGWHIWSKDQPAASLTNVGFNVTNGNGTDLFHASATSTNPILFLLESSNRFSAKLGRTGDNFPIDANTYKILSFRMCLSDNGPDANGQHVRLRSELQIPTVQNSVAYLFRTPNDADQPGLTQNGPIFTFAGCQVYTVDMTTSPVVFGQPWSGTIRSLRFDPTHIGGATIDLDYVRLTATATPQTFTWTGGAADIYLDNDNVASNGNLGMLDKDGVLARGVTTGYTFPMASLEGGNYFVRICPTNQPDTSSQCAYTGQIKVNGIPIVTVTAPSEEGSADDFATVQLGNAWDFDAVTDIDYYQNIASLSIDPAFPAQRPDGTDLGSIRVLKGTPSTTNASDPYFYTLFFAGTGRGVTKKIDADRYRILTIDMGLPGPRDINGGSIARVVWKSTAEAAENVSQDILVNHRAGVNILQKINVDMKSLLLETGGGLGVSGWNGQIENFRFDPHEFTIDAAAGRPIATDFWVNRIKLAAFETIGATRTYDIKWSASDPFDSAAATPATVSASYEGVNSQGQPNGTRTPIGACANVPAATGQCTWNTGSVLDGLYFVLLTISDGVNTNSAYSKYPIKVDQAFVPKPRIVLDRSLLNFGGTNSGQLTTPPQQLRLSVVGSGTVHWTAATQGSAANLFTVSPASGTGPAVLTVGIANTPIDNRVVGNLGTVVVTSAEADNSPQSATVYLAMTQTTTAPFGGFDTPADGATLQGSIAVTGWAIDDIGISKVDILRDANAGDPPGAVFNGKVFVGTATLVDGARSDIVALFPNSPTNYNAGWGYLMLTRGLIWDGKGPFKIYAQATDLDGHTVTLGSKTVTIDNANATKPFGAIDTPGQGGTASGNYPNTGWVLTPGISNKVPASGLQVAVDGVFLPNTFSMSDRSDITNGFSGSIFDTTGAGRGSFIDTTQFADGVHTIGWLVTDNLGRADGVGSRFFRTTNNVSSLTTADARPAMAGATTAFARLGDEATKLSAPRSTRAVTFGVGMTSMPVFKRAASVLDRSEIRIREMERVVLNVGAAEKGTSYAAYRLVDGQLRLLPIGTAFDTRKGAFYWLPAPGFIGDYDFVFVKNRNGIDVSQLSVRITVGPSTSTLRAGLFTPALTIAGRPE